MALLDKVFGKDERERQLEKEIKSLELRKGSVLAAIDTEIARLQGERNNMFLNAGMAAYEAWKKGDEQADLTEYWDKVKGLEEVVVEQQNKKTEMGVKYDEEIKLINSNLGINTASAQGVKHCPNCGMEISDDNIFCRGCGTKLK